MDNEFVTFTIGKKKHIALIAHDNENRNSSNGAKRIMIY